MSIYGANLEYSVDKLLYLDEQVDDLGPGPRGQVVEVGKDSAHDETSYLERQKKTFMTQFKIVDQ